MYGACGHPEPTISSIAEPHAIHLFRAWALARGIGIGTIGSAAGAGIGCRVPWCRSPPGIDRRPTGEGVGPGLVGPRPTPLAESCPPWIGVMGWCQLKPGRLFHCHELPRNGRDGLRAATATKKKRRRFGAGRLGGRIWKLQRRRRLYLPAQSRRGPPPNKKAPGWARPGRLWFWLPAGLIPARCGSGAC